MFFQLSTSFHYSTAKQIPWGRINKTSRSKTDVSSFIIVSGKKVLEEHSVFQIVT
jgi:hypothetical protein